MITAPVSPDRAGSDPRALVSQALSAPLFLPELMEGLTAEQTRRRFACAKALVQLSQDRPAMLYPYFDFFVNLLDHPNQVFRWNATRVLAHLATVDSDNRFGTVFDRFFAPIAGPVMIAAANVIQGAPIIARAKPALAPRITRELLKVTRARYDTAECRNVAIGHALQALEEMLELLSDPQPALRFAQRQLKNPRPATCRKAERLLKRGSPRSLIRRGRKGRPRRPC